MKILISTALALFFLTGLSTVSAVPPGMDISWEHPMGAVTFSGQTHMEKGNQCMDCHKDNFEQKKGTAKMTMAGMNEGKWCGSCHNGDKAFSTKDPTNCMTCHKQK
ncbi:MAG: cytochrome C [Gammaproteobacteria bacterium]|nr:cytochrome C [Gammaproteobacteria bacterium]